MTQHTPTAATANALQPVAISPVEDIVADMKAGRIVILVDEEDRENEGDLVLAADHVTAEAINFMARFGRGLICLTLTRERCEQLNLPPMVARNGDKKGTAFTVSIEAAEGVTTGISAADRAARWRPLWRPMPGPTTWCSLATSSLCKPLTAAC
jgi:3,4-dihydroxy 2-butanone 4-phosphate synthase/GTP cyclohydrolase II